MLSNYQLDSSVLDLHIKRLGYGDVFTSNKLKPFSVSIFLKHKMPNKDEVHPAEIIRMEMKDDLLKRLPHKLIDEVNPMKITSFYISDWYKPIEWGLIMEYKQFDSIEV